MSQKEIDSPSSNLKEICVYMYDKSLPHLHDSHFDITAEATCTADSVHVCQSMHMYRPIKHEVSSGGSIYDRSQVFFLSDGRRGDGNDRLPRTDRPHRFGNVV